MQLTITEEMRQALRDKGEPQRIVDPDTDDAYVVLRSDTYERVRTVVETERPQTTPGGLPTEMTPGIRRSKEAFRRDLPGYLADKKLCRKWVAYYGDERIGFGKTSTELYQACFRRGLQRGDFYVGKIIPTGLIEVEEIDPSLFEFDEIDESGNPIE